MNQRFKSFKIERLDPISPTFCAAKWLTADVYLHTGVTSSCHFPEPGPIDLAAAIADPLAVCNTEQKIQQRQQMLAGEQPPACSNCWNIEHADSSAISDRVYYSQAFEHRDFFELGLSPVVPESITLMLDNYCNFVCSYCDPTQSTSWASDLKTHGPFQILTDPKRTYQRLGTRDRLSDSDQQRLFDITVDFLTSNLDKIRTLSMLGGEPTINPRFWTLLDRLIEHDTKDLTLEVITNFSNRKAIQKLLDVRDRFKELRLVISIDGTARKAQFIRAGLNWDDFDLDVNNVLAAYPDVKINFSGTLNILALDGLIENCNWYKDLRQRWPDRSRLKIHILRWPSFQAINVLPTELKQHYREQITDWLKNNKDFTDTVLVTNLEQIKAVLGVDTDKKLEQTDFKTFVLEYSKRQRLDVKSTFSPELINWILTKE